MILDSYFGDELKKKKESNMCRLVRKTSIAQMEK
jgi:hypothetical protein